ncbi:MAG: GntR family transcriptional regulator [Rhizobiaceae bacterium]
MKQNAKAACADSIKQRVLSMELAPGQLLDETALSDEFGISRTPLREIIQRLCGEGFLSVHANRGAKVASMDLSTMRHFFQSAPMIYASVSRLAAEQATDEQISKLQLIQDAYRNAIMQGKAQETAMHNHRFHELIGDMAGSPYLKPSLHRLLIDHTRIGQVCYRSRGMEDDEKIETAANQHDGLIEAMSQNRAAEAVKLTLEHWELSRHEIEQFVTPDPLPFELADMEGELNHAV